MSNADRQPPELRKAFVAPGAESDLRAAWRSVRIELAEALADAEGYTKAAGRRSAAAEWNAAHLMLAGMERVTERLQWLREQAAQRLPPNHHRHHATKGNPP